MSTRAPAAIAAMYPPLQARYGASSVRRGGIVGDLAHRQRGGFHISRQDQPGSNYSVQGFNRNGPSDWAAAIDITLSDTLMRLFSARLRAAVNRDDPRVQGCLFEWFGTLNGRTVTGDLLYDTRNRPAGRTSSDSSHLWHVHISIRRDRITLAHTMALVDVLLGVPLAPPTPPTPTNPLDKEFDVATVREVLFAQVIDNPDPDRAKGNEKVSLADLAVMTYRAQLAAEKQIGSFRAGHDGAVKIVRNEVASGVSTVAAKVEATGTTVAGEVAAVKAQLERIAQATL